MQRFKLISLLCLFPTAYTYAEVDTTPGIFDSRFHTLETRLEGNFYAPAVIPLNGEDLIAISFDEIGEDRSYLRYSLVHCNADWQPSALVEAEYIDGFNEGRIENYEYSQLTKTHYTHYSLFIPNDDIRPTKSGNYLLRIYDENDPERTLLQTRFMVSEYSMKINAEITSRTDVDYNEAHQQISIVVDADRTPVQNIMGDLTVSVTQNGRLDNAVLVSRPSRFAGKIAYYEHLRPLIFPAGNEYRRVEFTAVNIPLKGVERTDYFEPFYHVTLIPDEVRSYQPYAYDQTQHGRFLVREYNSSQSEIEADYVVVHFSLPCDEIEGYDLFLDGDFTLRRFNPDSRLVYNRATGAYEASILLKQGAYNYQILAVPEGTTVGRTDIIEGDKYQTVNEYVIAVYHRQSGERYDRLTATATIYSGK